MALPVKQQLLYWGIAFVVFLAIMSTLGSVMLPFFAGAAVAYFLDPVADRLQRLGMSRVIATAFISLVALGIFVIGILLILPTMMRQAVQLVTTAPEIFNQLQNFLIEQFPDMMEPGSMVREALAGIGETIRARSGDLATGVLYSAMSLLSVVVFLVVTPVVAFYMLLDWNGIVRKIDAWLPRDHAPVIRELALEIDRVLAGFVRGQVTVCLLLGTYYSVGLMAAGLQFGLVVGAFSGAISFIPYVGSILGCILAIGLALYQFWGDWFWISVIAVIFVSGQLMESYVISPKLLGGSVGLHPLWLIFALSAFGSLYGFTGMLIAVPVSAVVGVLARFGFMRYTQSQLYQGEEHVDAQADDPDLTVRLRVEDGS